MCRRVCGGCGASLFADDSVEYPGFALCPACDECMTEDDRRESEEREWFEFAIDQDRYDDCEAV